MKAETAYQVIQALPEMEKTRLYNMLGMHTALTTKPNKPKKKQLITDAEATEYLLRKLRIF